MGAALAVASAAAGKPRIVIKRAYKKKWPAGCYTQRWMQDAVATTIDTRMRPAPVLSEISRRELYFFNLFRVIQAVIIGALLLSPPELGWMMLDHPLLGR